MLFSVFFAFSFFQSSQWGYLCSAGGAHLAKSKLV
jgi:hypothetical protein